MSREFLTDDQRDVLLRLIASRKSRGLSCLQVAKIFEARTGRKIARQAVSYAEKNGYEDRGVRANGHVLTPEQSALLETLITDEAPTYYLREIARRFTALTGRPLVHQSVHARLCKRGIAPGEAPYRGRPKDDGHAARLRRIEAEEADAWKSPQTPKPRN